MRIAVACLVLFLGLPPAADAYRADGVGLSSCGLWTHFRTQPDDLVTFTYESWVQGFLSGIGYIGPLGANPLGGMDVMDVLTWIDGYCRKNPLDRVAEAAAAFYRAHPYRPADRR
jgi:hypothetical protein